MCSHVFMCLMPYDFAVHQVCFVACKELGAKCSTLFLLHRGSGSSSSAQLGDELDSCQHRTESHLLRMVQLIQPYRSWFHVWGGPISLYSVSSTCFITLQKAHPLPAKLILTGFECSSNVMHTVLDSAWLLKNKNMTACSINGSVSVSESPSKLRCSKHKQLLSDRHIYTTQTVWNWRKHMITTTHVHSVTGLPNHWKTKQWWRPQRKNGLQRQ